MPRWRSDLAGEFEPLRPFLHPNGEKVTSLTCPNTRIDYKVIYYSDDDICAVDQETYDALP
jgi:hypothetical protein